MKSIFPPIDMADQDGLLFVGGEVDEKTLLDAYRRGIFPWPLSIELPLAWFSPDPRAIIIPEELKIGSSLKKTLSKNNFEFRMNTCFEQVIFQCARHHSEKSKFGTWITPQIIDGYRNLHQKGHAYSAETFLNGELVGGMYGVCINNFFSGESMYYQKDNASKFALVSFIQEIQKKKAPFFDIQMLTPTTKSLGGKYIARSEFLELLKISLES